MIFTGLKESLIFIFLTFIIFVENVQSVDLTYTEIKTVNDGNRFTDTHPDTKLTPFEHKVKHVRGNIIFTAGERVNGDRLVCTFLDETQFTKSEDIEVELAYPAKGTNGATISFIEIYADLSSDDANAYFFNGGINKKYASMLLECNQTRHFTYEIFIYGY